MASKQHHYKNDKKQYNIMKKSILLAAALVMSCAVFAQKDSLDAVIHVENAYTPVVTKATKKGFTPQTEESATQAPLELDFSRTSNPFKGFTSERDVTELLPGQKESLPGYVRVGYGNGNNADALASYIYNITKRDKIKAVASIKGYSREIDGVLGKWDSRFFSSWASTDYSHQFDKLLLGTTATFENNVFNYQTTLPTDKQNNMKYSAAVYGESRLAGPFAYDFKVGYAHSGYKHALQQDDRIAENRLYAEGGIKREFDGEIFNNINLGAKVNYYSYKNYTPLENFLSTDLNPFTNITIENFRIHIGANVNILTGNGALFAITPDLSVEATMSKSVTLYGSIKGERKPATFASFELENPYWASGTEKPEHTIADITAGARITNESLSVDIFAGYAYTKDNLLFDYLAMEIPTAPDFTDRFVHAIAFSENTARLYTGAQAKYDYEGWLKTEGAVKYNYWKCDNKAALLMKPEFELNLAAEARMLDDFYVTLAYNFATYGHDVPSLNKNELNLRTSYKMKERFGAYIEGNNLLNRKYFKYAGYYNQGINILFGLSASF